MDHGTTLPGALRRAPFALLAWVLSALTPTDLLGPDCRALVLRALVNLSTAIRVLTGADAALRGTLGARERATLGAVGRRTTAAIAALGADPAALVMEALPAPSTAIEGRTVARVLLAFMNEARRRTGDADGQLADAFGTVIDPELCDLLAVRASALQEGPREPKPTAKRRK